MQDTAINHHRVQTTHNVAHQMNLQFENLNVVRGHFFFNNFNLNCVKIDNRRCANAANAANAAASNRNFFYFFFGLVFIIIL